MAYGLNDRVREQVSAFAGGTGAVTLPVSAVSGFQTFLAGWGASGTGEYCLVIGAQWETGFGTLNAGGTTLTRTTTYNGSSGSGVAVNFNAGTMDCFGDIPAELAQHLNMREITVASATTCDIGAVAGSNIVVSGTTTITGFGTKANRRRYVRFSGALTLTYNASSLILPGAANIITVAGDTAVFQSDASGNWRCVSYLRSTGLDGQFGMRNRIVNPSGQFLQLGVGSRADGALDFDQWYTLTQANPVTVSQQTSVENGTPFMMRSLQANASAQRFGRIQHIEFDNSVDLRGQAVTLSARVRMSASTTLRYAIIEWTGTANAPTKDVVSDWTSGTFTTSNFFIATTTTITATGSVALTANTLASISLTGTIGSSANNIAVFFWTDTTQAQNVTLDIGKAQLEIGSIPTAYAYCGYKEELRKCQRHIAKTYDPAVLPAAATSTGSSGGQATGTVAQRPFVPWAYPETMAKTPAVTYYSPVTGTSGQLANLNTSADVAANSYSVGQSSLIWFPSGTLAVGDAVVAHIVVNASI